MDKKDIEDYEKDYLERLKAQETKKPPPQSVSYVDEPLTPFDYVLLGLIRNGISKMNNLTKRLKHVSLFKVDSAYRKLLKRNYFSVDKNDGWFTRNLDPTLKLTKKGSETIEQKIDELQEEWDRLVSLYEKKNKEKLREGMQAQRNFFPLMMMMGITNGMMMGNMLGMNHMMMGDFMAEIDYAYDAGFADGELGLQDGGEFGDSGDGGGFMDAGFQPGF